ncbi:MAG: hypothetical protein J6Y02_06675 [Pseudobutyrivibrio sp.]|nr:hypothetical protein [Pseudobutyrivibrio sp.]
MVTKKLKCEDCGGIMEIDQAKSILCCPYCGSKELIEESDDVKKAKIKADIELRKIEYMERKANKSQAGDIIVLVLLILFTLACVAIPLLTQ